MGVKVGTPITTGTTGVRSGAMSLPALLSTAFGSTLATTRLCSALALASFKAASVFRICSCNGAGRLFVMLSKPWYVTCPAREEAYSNPATAVCDWPVRTLHIFTELFRFDA